MQECEVKNYNSNRKLLNKNANKKPKNFFTIQYDDEDPLDFIVGSNIKDTAPIIKYIKKFNIGDKFDYNGESVRLLFKNI